MISSKGTFKQRQPEDDRLRDRLMDIVAVYSLTRKKVISISPSVEAVTGLSPEAVYARGFEALFPEESLAVLKQKMNFIRRNMASGDGTDGGFLKEIELFGRAGQRLWFEFSLQIFEASNREIMVHAIGRDISEKKALLWALRESEKRFRDLVEKLREIVFEIDGDARIRYISPNVKALTGYEPEELLGGPLGDLPLDVKNDRSLNRTLRLETKDGRTLHFRASGSKTEVRGVFKGFKGTLTDITETMRTAERERFLSTVLMGISDSVIVTNASFRITDVNPATHKNTGYSAGELIGATPGILFKDFFNKDSFTKFLSDIKRRLIHTREGRLCKKDGTVVMSEVKISSLVTEEGAVYAYVGIIRDISAYKEREKQLFEYSYHDNLTGLYNRRYCESRTPEFDRPQHLPLGVIVVDINGLKLMNDVFGHRQGDELIRTTARILSESAGKQDLVCRTGGDEFEIITPGTSEEKLEKFTQRIHKRARGTAVGSIQVSFAAGYALKRSPEQDLELVRQEAENNMYGNKIEFADLLKNQMIHLMLKDLNRISNREYTHGKRVSQYCEIIGRTLKLEDKEVANLRILGEIHDIGKIKLSGDILNKPARLTPDECEEVKKHPVTGYQIVKSVDEFTSLAEGILYHHERWDGRGYPKGLSGKMIPLQSRIIAVADAYEAMTSNRSWARRKNREEAVAEMRRHSGSQFDPEILDTFIRILT